MTEFFVAHHLDMRKNNLLVATIYSHADHLMLNEISQSKHAVLNGSISVWILQKGERIGVFPGWEAGNKIVGVKGSNLQ